MFRLNDNRRIVNSLILQSLVLRVREDVTIFNVSVSCGGFKLLSIAIVILYFNSFPFSKIQVARTGIGSLVVNGLLARTLS